VLGIYVLAQEVYVVSFALLDKDNGQGLHAGPRYIDSTGARYVRLLHSG